MTINGRKLRTDLTTEQLAKLQEFGSVGFESQRDANKMSHGSVKVFIPSKEQH